MDVGKYVADGYKCVKDASTTTVPYKVEQIGNDEMVVKAEEGTPNGTTFANLDGGFNGEITTVTNSDTISGATVTSVGQKALPSSTAPRAMRRSKAALPAKVSWPH